MPRLDLRGDDSIVRVCGLVSETEVVLGESVIRACDECDAPIWYDTAQVGPPHPKTGMPVKETHCLCPPCFLVHLMREENPAEWLFGNEREENE